jgi:hypothetical protein
MRKIGGFFELELNTGKEYHNKAIRLNLGRTSFEYILRVKKVSKIYLPWYTCDVLLEPLDKLGIKYIFYRIESNLEPVLNLTLFNDTDYLLYINYFGIKNAFISQLSQKVKNLIIDNSQSFYSSPLQRVDTFYSPRKFFGVPDGGYLYTDSLLQNELKIDNSSDRFRHLIGRIENGPVDSYQNFKKNEFNQNGQELKRMSNITHRLMQNVNYKSVARKRERHFLYMHKYLADKNLLNIDLNSIDVPMVYPFFTSCDNLRRILIESGIYVAQYWPNVLAWTDAEMIEYKLVKNLIPLPIDQRYNLRDMKIVIDKVLKYA